MPVPCLLTCKLGTAHLRQAGRRGTCPLWDSCTPAAFSLACKRHGQGEGKVEEPSLLLHTKHFEGFVAPQSERWDMGNKHALPIAAGTHLSLRALHTCCQLPCPSPHLACRVPTGDSETSLPSHMGVGPTPAPITHAHVSTPLLPLNRQTVDTPFLSLYSQGFQGSGRREANVAAGWLLPCTALTLSFYQ